MSTRTITMTPAEEAAWSVASVAIAAAYDVTVAAMLTDLAETFPKVAALKIRGVDGESGRVYILLSGVLIGETYKGREEIKPENATALDDHLDRWLGFYDLPGHVADALVRATSTDGYIHIPAPSASPA